MEELRALIKKMKAVVWKGCEKEVDDEQPRSDSPQTDDYSEVNGRRLGTPTGSRKKQLSCTKKSVTNIETYLYYYICCQVQLKILI